MCGLDDMFGFSEDHHYHRGSTMLLLPCLDDQHPTMHELGAVTQKNFDRLEATILLVHLYRVYAEEEFGSEHEQDDFGLEEENVDEASLALEHGMAFDVFGTPPVPEARQWYQSDQETSTPADDD